MLPVEIAATLQAGLKHHQAGNLAQAEALYRQALEGAPDDANALHFLGLACSQQGRHDEAVQLIGRALARDPGHAPAHCNLGWALAGLGRHEEAVASYRKALALRPGLAEAHNNLGNSLCALGHHEEALAGFRTALALKPEYVEAHHNLGNALCALDRHAEALAGFRAALSLRPDYLQAHNSLGNALGVLQRHEAAAASFREALRLDPDNDEVNHNLGVALLELDRYEEAADRFRCALVIRPAYAEAHNHLGVALSGLHRHDDAIASFQAALMVRPLYVDAHTNLGFALGQHGRGADALASFARALAIRPGHVEARWNRALVRLALGDFKGGWEDFEWRWEAMPALQRREFPQPLWLGREDVAGSTILLHAEQGLGDTLQFVRYAPLLARLGARVLLLVQPPLKSLLAGLEGVTAVYAEGEVLPAFDYHCPLMSLPHAFGTELTNIPAATPYVYAEAERAARWQARLGTSAEPKIGLVWAGSAREHNPAAHRVDRRRSMALAQFAPLAEVPGVRFVSLQKGPPAEQAQNPPPGMELIDHTAELNDFADTAALVSALDLVITVDTAVAHLAGAMGKPVWILSRFDGCWRWLIEREDSPWYPSARLFRQPSAGDWTSVIERVARELRRWSHQAAARPTAERRNG